MKHMGSIGRVRAYKKNERRIDLLLYVLVVLMAFIWAFPAFWGLINSIKPAHLVFAIPPVWTFKPTFENYKHIFNALDFIRFFRNTVVVAGFATVLSVALGTLGAYGIARFKVGGIALPMSILAVRMIPSSVLALPFFVMFQRWNLLDTRVGLVVAHTALNLPFAIWLMLGYLDGVPRELEEAALVDGCGKLSTFLRITLPLLKPGLVVTAVFCMLASWNEFFYALVLTVENAKTMPVATTLFITGYGIKWGSVCAASTFIMLPAAIFTLLLQKHIVKGLTLGGLK